MKLLVTGATGKVGSRFLLEFAKCNKFAGWEIVALCNNRLIEAGDGVSVIQGSLADKSVIKTAMAGATHVLHMAAVKESPDLVIDVAIKGMFQMLEEFRKSPTAQQFMLISGDCSVGHIFHDYGAPVTEKSPRRAYPGCYALTKVLEEVMLEQYQIQYGINGCCLRAPWIMEKDDFRYVMSFGEDQFGGPPWSDLLSAKEIERYASDGFVPVMLDAKNTPLRRNFVHVSDLVTAILAALDCPQANGQLFNITMDEPVNYAQAADYLQASRNYSVAEIPSPYFSNWLSNSKARLMLNWRPEISCEAMIDRAWNYKRPKNEPRKIWYPG
ncbi:MAG: NAD(P)-dependent oxidoreductase [Paracoccaceae bacterium]